MTQDKQAIIQQRLEAWLPQAKFERGSWDSTQHYFIYSAQPRLVVRLSDGFIAENSTDAILSTIDQPGFMNELLTQRSVSITNDGMHAN